MLIHRSTFDSIESFIDHMKQNENMLGIVEYGGRAYTDMSIGGLWNENEVLFHLLPNGENDENEQNRFLKILTKEMP